MTEDDQKSPQWLVIIGDLEDGFAFIGPYNRYEDADGYIGTNPDAHIVKLVHPDDAT
jgi:hypothetical protein